MQVVADFSVDGSSGALAQQDYFEPFDYQNLNGGDRDFGSSGVSLLDPSVFSGGGVKRLAVAAGKNGKVRKEAQNARRTEARHEWSLIVTCDAALGLCHGCR